MRDTVRSSEVKTVCARNMETASTREEDFRLKTVSRKSRNDLETEIETVGSETETSKNYLETCRDRGSVWRTVMFTHIPQIT